MRNIDKEFEILLDQRSKLVDELSKTNSTFQKTILAFFTGLATIVAADRISALSSGPVVLFLLQMIVMLTFFIIALLISGNNKRYYISAIDDYVWEEYGIGVLIFQGTLSRKHTLSPKSLFGATTSVIAVLVTCMVVWMIFAFNIQQYIRGNIGYIVLLCAELAAMAVIVGYNIFDKQRIPQVYKECLAYLRRYVVRMRRLLPPRSPASIVNERLTRCKMNSEQ